MGQAKNLGELFEIREHSQERLGKVRGLLCTGLARKNGVGDPCITVFVERKIGAPWLSRDQRVPKILRGPRGLFSPTDVVATETTRARFLATYRDRQGDDQQFVPVGEVVSTPPIVGVKAELRDQLRGAASKLTPGSVLAYDERDEELGASGTLACFARSVATGEEGLLTNSHVGDHLPGNRLWHPEADLQVVGTVRRSIRERSAHDRYGSQRFPFTPGEEIVTVDAAFVPLDPNFKPGWRDLRLPIAEGKQVKRVRLGEPWPLDLDTMGPVGERVAGSGPTRSYQEGHIVAAAVDYVSGSRRYFSDYRIVGDDGGVFSDPGDSGKLIVTRKDWRPVAIMWGGDWERRASGEEAQNFTDATDIGYIVDELGVEIVR